ncbi:MAG: TatD family hydrolase [Alphaproteobacteria bacterium]|nr:TatD family hydrolase [Alphaproteobacteria bacterium]
MLVDSHCHLDYLERRGENIAAVLQRAKAVGVECFLDVATTLVGEPKLREYCATYPGVFRSVGVHPNHATEEPDVCTEELIALSDQPKVIALGECGIDYFREHTTPEIQKKVFRTHLEAAQVTDLPLIIHTRNADEDTIAVMQEVYREKPFRGVFHCYTGSEAILAAAQEMDFYISVTGILTYGKSQELRERVAGIAPSRLMVETDAPFLAPKPHRGKQCEPYMVRHTADMLGELLDLNAVELAEQTTTNFFRLFKRAKLEITS